MSNQNQRDDQYSTWRTLLFTIIGGVIAIVGGVVAQYSAAHFQFTSQVRLQKVQDQRQVFARLMGQEFITKQLYVSRFEALIFSDYHEARRKHFGSPQESLDLREAQRWMHRSEDLVFEIAKNNQALFEDLGRVRALFPDVPRLRQLVERVHEFKTIKRAQLPQDASIEKLMQWKDKAVKQLQTFVDREYGAAIDELLDYLAQQLPAEG